MKLTTKLMSCICLLAVGKAAMCSPDALSTNRDGSLQAIAQGPDTIAVYWKCGEEPGKVFIDGVQWSGPDYSVNPETGFACAKFSGLEPNRAYLFSLSEKGPGVVEKTWSAMPGRRDYDLLIIGGTASGTAAAVTAARLGMSVALVEETNRLGGMASNGLGSTDIRDMARANGFFDDFRRRAIEFYGGTDGRFYESRVANAIFKDMVYAQPGIALFMRCSAARPILQDGTVLGARIRDNISGGTGELRAAMTIDATYTGDFAAACGAKFRLGREPRSPEEPHAGVIYFDNAKQEILPGSTGEGDRLQQSYAYLMIWKDYGEAQAPQIEKPLYYDPETYRHSPEWNKTWNYLYGRLPGGKFEINQHPFGIDWPGINHDYPTAPAERRKEIEEMYRHRALGYLYFMQNERGHKNLGLADSEFLDSGNFPQQLYIREARRIMGDYLFRENDVTAARETVRPESIAIGDYPMDSHAMEDLKDPNRIDKGEGEAWLKSFTPWYQVPPGVLVPRGINGLLVSTAVSGTHIGYGTLRMEPVRMSLGQAAAAMAYWSVLHSLPAREVSPAWVQDKILSQRSCATWYSDVSRDTRHFEAIQFLGTRGMFAGEQFRPDEPMTYPEAMGEISSLFALEGKPRSVQTPEGVITRGEFARRLVEAKQETSEHWSPVQPPGATYADVQPESPYYSAVETLAAHRITAMLFENAEPGLFKPDAPISRADAAQAVYLAHREFAMRRPQGSRGLSVR